MIRRLLPTVIAPLILLALTSVTRADTVTLVGRAGTGVTATITDYTLDGSTFTFTITNTTVAGTASAGTITGIGFNLPGSDRGSFTLVSRTDPDFRLESSVSGNATGLNTTFDFALVTGSNYNGGKPNNGIAPRGSETFTVTGDFSNLKAQQIAESIFARFQRVGFNDGSDVAGFNGSQPQQPAPVPEPATMILLGTGLAGTAARLRQRHKAAQR